MQRMLKGRRPSPAMILALIALFVAVGAGTVYAGSKISGKTVKKNSLPGNRIKKNTVTGKQVKESTLGTVPKATNAAQATNADTVGGNHLGFAHITFGGTTNPSVDGAQSTAGVTVTQSNPFVASTTCVQAPFTLHSVVGSVDYVADPGENEIVEATVVTGTGHRCPAGQIEVNTQNAFSSTPVTVDYYLMFS